MNWSDMSPRERDALVAEKVMGWKRYAAISRGERVVVIASEYARCWHIYMRSQGDPGTWEATNEPLTETRNLKHYTTDISAAWEVVEEMVGEIKGAPYAEIAIKPYLSEQVSGHKWCVKLDHVGPGPRMGDTDRFNRWWVSAPTASEAICLAALRAKGVEV